MQLQLSTLVAKREKRRAQKKELMELREMNKKCNRQLHKSQEEVERLQTVEERAKEIEEEVELLRGSSTGMQQQLVLIERQAQQSFLRVQELESSMEALRGKLQESKDSRKALQEERGSCFLFFFLLLQSFSSSSALKATPPQVS